MKHVYTTITLCLFLVMVSKGQNSTGMPSGNIGIGVPNPSSLLQVHNLTVPANVEGSTSIISTFSGDAGNFSQFKFLQRRHTLVSTDQNWTTIGSRLQFVTDVSDQGYLEFNPKGAPWGLAFGSAGKELMRLQQNGSLGVGTLTPWARMDVRTDGGSGGDQHALNIQNPSSDPYATVSMTLGSGQIGSFSMISAQRNNGSNGSSLYFQTTDAAGAVSPRMWINPEGNVGVGTQKPAGKLQVSDGADDWTKYGSLQIVRSETPSDHAFHLSFVRNGNRVAGIGFQNNSNLFGIWQANDNSGVPLMGFTPEQNVGIGTTDPKGYKLAVNGAAIFTKAVVKLQGNWPDFVFASSYKLPSLPEVEAFIQKHHHLPDVPSAREVAEKGLDLGESQAVLLRKVEELTLYIIEQNKTLEKLGEQAQKSAALEAQNKSLEERLRRLEEKLK